MADSDLWRRAGKAAAETKKCSSEVQGSEEESEGFDLNRGQEDADTSTTQGSGRARAEYYNHTPRVLRETQRNYFLRFLMINIDKTDLHFFKMFIVVQRQQNVTQIATGETVGAFCNLRSFFLFARWALST